MTSKKPLIALTPNFNTEREEPYMRPTYLKAIRAAGGIPLILPLDLEEEDLIQLVDTCDGFLFTGVRISTLFTLAKKPRHTAARFACAGTAWNWPC